MPIKKVITTAIDRVDSPYAMQRIDRVNTTPGVSSVIIQFDTLFATVPIVETSKVERDLHAAPNPVFSQFPIFGGIRQSHTIEFRELEPFTWYQFNIKAAGGPDGGVGIASYFGDFFTSKRSGQILFDSLHIFNRADRDMYFNIEIYHGDGDNRILSRFLTGHRFLDTGQYDLPFPNVGMSFAPDSLRFSITGYDEDESFGDFGFSGFAHGKGPDTLPYSVADGNSYVDSEQAILTGIVQTIELGQFATPAAQTIPLSLNSLNKRFGYGIRGRIIFQVTDHPETIRRARIAEKIKNVVKSATTKTVGQSLAVGGKPGGGKDGGGKIERPYVFALGPDNTAYRQISTGSSDRSSWQHVGDGLSGPLTALGSDRGTADVFATGENRSLLHAHFDDPEKQKSRPVWSSLGEIVDPLVFAIRGADGAAHLFGFDRTFAVRHLKIPVTGAYVDDAWENLEG